MTGNNQTQKRAIVILNGNLDGFIPEESTLGHYDYVLAVDGALDRLMESGIRPDAITGDFDSVKPATLEAFRKSGGNVNHQFDQETTDFEKALRHLERLGVLRADVSGYLGTRIDHVLGILHVCCKYSDRFELRLLTLGVEASFLRDSDTMTLQGSQGMGCSVMPLLPCTDVTLSGFRWPLERAQLVPGGMTSISNEITAPEASISLGKGCLMITLFNKGVKDHL